MAISACFEPLAEQVHEGCTKPSDVQILRAMVYEIEARGVVPSPGALADLTDLVIELALKRVISPAELEVLAALAGHAAFWSIDAPTASVGLRVALERVVPISTVSAFGGPVLPACCRKKLCGTPECGGKCAPTSRRVPARA